MGRFALALLVLAFDAATIPTTLAGCYVIKRSVRLDVVRNVDMLPDQLIEGWMEAFRSGRDRGGAP